MCQYLKGDSDQGAATASTALVLMLVGALAASVALWAQWSSSQVQNAEAHEKVLIAARSGLAWAIRTLTTDATPEVDSVEETWAKGRTWKVQDHYIVTVTVRDEGSKLDYHTAPETWIRAVSEGRLASKDSSPEKELDPEMIHDLWELRDKVASDQEWPRLSEQLTTYALYPMNTMSEAAWVKLLQLSGLPRSSAQAAAREIVGGRQARPLKTINDLLMVAPTLDSTQVRKFSKRLSAEGTINVNLAPQAVLELLAQTVGIGKGKVETLISLRMSKPYTDMAEVIAIWGTQAQSLPLTLKSRVFYVTSTAQENGREAQVDAIVFRSWDKERHQWSAEVWAWSERVHAL